MRGVIFLFQNESSLNTKLKILIILLNHVRLPTCTLYGINIIDHVRLVGAISLSKHLNFAN